MNRTASAGCQSVMKPGCVLVWTAVGRSSAGPTVMPSSSIPKGCAHPPQRRDRCDESCLRAAGHADRPARDEAGDQVGKGLDPIAADSLARSGEGLFPLDHEAPVGLQLDPGAHALQEERQLDDLGLDRRVLEHGPAVRGRGGEQHRLGRADAREGQSDPGAVQAARLGL